MTSQTVRVGLVQMSTVADKAANLEKAYARVLEAKRQGAELVCLQELFASPYFCQTEDAALFDLAEPIPGPTTQRMAEAARAAQVTLVVPLFERRARGLYHNSLVVLGPDGSLLGTYRKMHIPDDPAFYEKFYFTPGDLGFEPVQTSMGKLGVLVCWDQWYPEAARLMALAGADLLLYPTAIGWDPADDAAEKTRQRDAWITVQRGHAVANGLPLLACNRTGHEPAPTSSIESAARGIDFWGSSFTAGPQGEMLAQASMENPELLIADIDLARSEAVRRIWPFLRDRRIDAYSDLLRRFRD